MTCPHLARSAAVSVVVVWAPGLPRPRVIPAEGEFRPCRDCDMLFDEVARTVACKGIEGWTSAIVLDVEGKGFRLTYRGPKARA